MMTSMSSPKICAMSPEVMEMEPGTYWWCSCGFSATQPFCDGAHKACKDEDTATVYTYETGTRAPIGPQPTPPAAT